MIRKSIVLILLVIVLMGCVEEENRIEVNEFARLDESLTIKIVKYNEKQIALLKNNSSIEIRDLNLRFLREFKKDDKSEINDILIDEKKNLIFASTSDGVNIYSKELKLIKYIKLRKNLDKDIMQYFSIIKVDEKGSIYLIRNEGNLRDLKAELLKLNSNGELVFEKAIGSEEGIKDIFIDNTENVYYISGYEDEKTKAVSKHDVEIVKMDKNGNYLWKEKYATAENDWPVGLRRDKIGNLICFIKSEKRDAKDNVRSIPVVLKVHKDTGKTITSLEADGIDGSMYEYEIDMEERVYLFNIERSGQSKKGEFVDSGNIFIYNEKGKLIKRDKFIKNQKIGIYIQNVFVYDKENIYVALRIKNNEFDYENSIKNDSIVLKIDN